MGSFSLKKRILCAACAVAMLLAVTACGKNGDSARISEANPWELSDPGTLTDEGYELPYTYPDGYKAVIQVVGNCEYVNANKTPAGNMTFWLKTDKSEEEVKKFYDDYFSKLQKVMANSNTDQSIGYFDPDKRLIMYNLTVWTTKDGVTNYKMGAEACDKLEDSKTFIAVKDEPTTVPQTVGTAPPRTTAPATTSATAPATTKQ